MKDLDNIGRKFNEDYLVFTTSGSTGDPLVMLCDRNTNNIMGGISTTRAFARKQDLKAFLKAGKKQLEYLQQVVSIWEIVQYVQDYLRCLGRKSRWM
ncbi:hypothetical protein KQI42_17810 [Tissierella sp. MSJ-40]|uniref:Uncharacterized protein n=1 Tax=Tissierella simiarum TaxID=2841534 RepID=A0ABS6EAC1_9FIRM|nr:hypothetical protein [Tissierella simiarum]MBU5439874.1 hypothetical protein [Tissierella simiarum]